MDIYTRNLKYATWSYDFENNQLILDVIDRKDPTKQYHLVMNKTYAFSLGRFLISVWQKLSANRRRKKKAKK